MYKRYGKKVLDITICCFVQVLLLPIFIVVALLVWISSPGPILFTQWRAGWKGKAFRTFKFRSMKVNQTDPLKMGKLSQDNELVTPIGRILRRFRVDELPQIWNVFLGEMSLVGPRPALFAQVNNYTDEQRGRLEALPGITGWAQVNGNTELTWDERIRLDLWYVENQSVWLDFKIMLMTIDVIFRGERPRTEALREVGIRRGS